MKRLFVLFCIAVVAAQAQAAKVIMNDGKTFEGRIIAETDGDVLIKTSPVDRPKLLPNEEILTVIRDPIKEVPRDPQRYVAFGARLLGDIHSSENITVHAAPSLALDAGFRFHPLIELGANLEWVPALSGLLAVTDGTNPRSYESFYAYGGALWARFFPVYMLKPRFEPFLMFGYHWNNVIPKGSDDEIKGGGLTGGVGVQWAWRKNLYAQAGVLYQRARYGVITYLNRDGALDPPVHINSVSLFVGLSWHVL